MQTEVLSAYTKDGALHTRHIARAAAYVTDGAVVAMPTETVYGLAANAYDEAAVAKIFAAKGRPQDNPLIVHIADLAPLSDLTKAVPASAYALAKAFWPGPLTMILPKSERVPDAVSAGLATVAVRMPSHPVAQALIRAAGVPLAAPSANRSGSPSPTNAKYVLADMRGRIPLILDGGSSQVGVESTVVTLATDVPRVLRPGGVTVEQLRAVLGEVAVDDAVLHRLKAGAQAASPGMKYKHYAPQANITVVRGSLAAFRDFVARQSPDAFVLCFTGEEKLFRHAVSYGHADADDEQANRLFDALRELDENGAKTVYARCPRLAGVGLAVYNRLIRAAGFQLTDAECIRKENGGVCVEVIGITGQTGAGKSTVCAALKDRGYRHIDADAVAKTLYVPHTPVVTRLAAAFGQQILQPDGGINRQALADAAFASPAATAQLNALVHPAVTEKIRLILEKERNSGAKAVIIDAIALFESGAAALCNRTVGVVAPEQVRLQRIMARDGLTEAQAIRRIRAQQDEAFYKSRCDAILHNYPPYDFAAELQRVFPK